MENIMKLTSTHFERSHEWKMNRHSFSQRYETIQQEIKKIPWTDTLNPKPNHGQLGHKGYKRIKQKDAIKRFKSVHGEKYYYGNTVYKNYGTPVRVMCPEHGEFLITPKQHFRGLGCEECKSLKPLNKK